MARTDGLFPVGGALPVDGAARVGGRGQPRVSGRTHEHAGWACVSRVSASLGSAETRRQERNQVSGPRHLPVPSLQPGGQLQPGHTHCPSRTFSTCPSLTERPLATLPLAASISPPLLSSALSAAPLAPGSDAPARSSGPCRAPPQLQGLASAFPQGRLRDGPSLPSRLHTPSRGHPAAGGRCGGPDTGRP